MRFSKGSRLLFILLISLFITVCESKSQDSRSIISQKAERFDEASEITNLTRWIGDERLVLMGEASHGTSEFYLKRALLSKELIQQKGFHFIVVEGDWASFSRINEFVKHKSGGPQTIDDAMDSLTRWPQWMWRNVEFKELVGWLHEYNRDLLSEERIGLYGMDVYDNESSMEDVVEWIASQDSSLGRRANRAYSCLSRHSHIGNYLRMVAQSGEHCGEDMQAVLEIVRTFEEDENVSRWEFFKAEQGAKVAINAELHYRANLEQNSASWNYRASHFYLTVERLLTFYGEDSRGLVWAHNTHIGDARATSMGNHGMVNIGQLSREALGKDKTYAIGFGTYNGRVLAASEWEGEMQVMNIPNAVEGTWEQMLMETGVNKFYLNFKDPELASALTSVIAHRAIGVTYNPAGDRNNFVPTILPERYDAFIFFQTTDILEPLD